MSVLKRLATRLLCVGTRIAGLFGYKPKKRAAPVTPGYPHQFFRSGVQYYLHGRVAFLMRDEPSVAGNLFHQGFEMVLKAALLQRLYDKFSPGWADGIPEAKRKAAIEAYSATAEKLLEKKIRHWLPKAWTRFKALHPGANLNTFDTGVAELDAWWRVRYPGFPEGTTLQIRTSIVEGGQPQVAQAGPVDDYELCLETMDRLFEAVAPLDWSLHMIAQSIDPAQRGAGLRAYQDQNRHPLQL